MGHKLSAERQRTLDRRWLIIAAVLIGTWVGAAGNSMLPVALPVVVRDYAVELNLGVWIISVYTLFVAVCMPIFGWLGDRYGYRRLYGVGLLGMAFFAWAAALAPSFFWLIFFRALQGITAATFLPAVMGITSAIFSEQERGLALGMWALVNGAGHGLGPILSGYLVEFLGWSAVFWFLGAVSSLAAMAVFWLAPIDYKRQEGSFDLLGAATFTSAILIMMFALSHGSAIGWRSPLSLGMWITCFGLFTLFILTERRVSDPFVELQIFRSWRYVSVTAIAGAQFFYLMGIPILMALYLIDYRGLSAGWTGVLIAPLAVASALFSPVGGWLTDRYGFRTLLIIGMGIMTAAAGSLLFWGSATPISIIVLTLIVMGIGMGFTQSPSATGITLVVSDAKRGVAMGIFHMLRFISGTLSVTVFGLILANAHRAGVSQPQAFYWSFYLLVGVSAAALVLALSIPRRRPHM